MPTRYYNGVSKWRRHQTEIQLTFGSMFYGIIATDTDNVRVHLYGFTEVCGLGQSKGCTVATDFFPLMCMDYVLHVNFVYSLSIFTLYHEKMYMLNRSKSKKATADRGVAPGSTVRAISALPDPLAATEGRTPPPVPSPAYEYCYMTRGVPNGSAPLKSH